MTDLGNIETAAKAELATEANALKPKALAFVKKYAVKVGLVAFSYIAGHFGWIGAVLQALL